MAFRRRPFQPVLQQEAKGTRTLNGLLTVLLSPQVLPLRQRPADVGPLAESYALEAAGLRGYRGVTLTTAALRQLTSYSFPVNQEVGGKGGGGAGGGGGGAGE
jgi:DNA-binding NtrC family response regulator